MIFSMIFSMIHKISCYRVKAFMGVAETRWLNGSLSMVYRNNAGRLGSGFISVCLETRWLGQKSGFYVPERLRKYCHHLADGETRSTVLLSLVFLVSVTFEFVS